MNEAQFNNVSVLKEPLIKFGGRCISRAVLFDDGKKKMLGVILPGTENLKFETHTSEKMEITSGDCEVRIAGEDEFKRYRSGQSFFVKGKSTFALRCDNIVGYICHLEG